MVIEFWSLHKLRFICLGGRLMMKKRDNLVLAVYDDEGVDINKKILELFEKYVLERQTEK